MDNKDKVQAKTIISRILSEMKDQKYAGYTIYRYRLCYERLLEFMEQRGEQVYTAEVGIAHVQAKFGILIEDLFGKQPKELRETIRALQVLWDYSEYGTMVTKLRPKHAPFSCSDGFRNAIRVYETNRTARSLTLRSHSTHMYIIKRCSTRIQGKCKFSILIHGIVQLFLKVRNTILGLIDRFSLNRQSVGHGTRNQ